MEKQTPNAVVVVNRQAAGLVRDGRLLDAVRRRRGGVRVVETRSIADLEDVARDADEGVVVLAGGDGSYMAGVTAFARARLDRPDRPGRAMPAFALAPGGTVSTVARNWSPRGRPFGARYAERLLDAIAAGRAKETARPTLRVSDEEASRVGFIAGAGLVARFFEVYEAEGARGYAGAARVVARIFAGSIGRGGKNAALAHRVLAPARVELRVDGAAVPFDRASLVCASVVRDLGLHMRLTYRAGRELDRFHVVATPLGPSELGPQLGRVLAGRPLRGPRLDALARSLSLRFPPGEGAYVLDGEILRRDAIDVAPGPVLRVLGL